MRTIVIGVAPLALLGAVAAMVMFYPTDSGSGPESEPVGGGEPPVAPFTPEPLPTAELFLPGVSNPPTPTADSSAAPRTSATTAPSGVTPRRTPAMVGRPRPSPVRQVTRQVSGLAFRRASNFWGPVERNTSNGEDEAGDGQTMRIEGQRFSTGLGVHAPSRVELDLAGRCSAFSAFLGLDDEEGSDPRKNVGAVVFSVLGDDRTLYRSPVVQPDDDARPVTVGVAGVRTLTLHVDDLGSTKNDHADWAGAAVRCHQ